MNLLSDPAAPLPIRAYTDAQARLLTEFKAATTEFPREAFEVYPWDTPEDIYHAQLWQNRVRIDVVPKPDDLILIFSIAALTPLQGHGGAALNWLTKLADKHRMALEVSVSSSGERNNPLRDNDALSDWYHRRGFVTVRNNIMRRIPR